MNCNDYIIKNNRDFTRDFETMYREVSDPWGQEARGLADTSFKLLVSSLKHLYQGGRIVDIGCGPGHLSKAFKQELAAEEYIGCDISEAAILKAKLAFPELSFHQLNIIESTLDLKANLVTALKTLYYCAPEIDITISHINSMLVPDGLFAYSYNIKGDSFTKQFLDIETLRQKMEGAGFKKVYISDYYISDERIAIDIFQKIGT
jgi:trans-aconitate methyltransferase